MATDVANHSAWEVQGAANSGNGPAARACVQGYSREPAQSYRALALAVAVTAAAVKAGAVRHSVDGSGVVRALVQAVAEAQGANRHSGS